MSGRAGGGVRVRVRSALVVGECGDKFQGLPPLPSVPRSTRQSRQPPLQRTETSCTETSCTAASCTAALPPEELLAHRGQRAAQPVPLRVVVVGQACEPTRKQARTAGLRSARGKENAKKARRRQPPPGHAKSSKGGATRGTVRSSGAGWHGSSGKSKRAQRARILVCTGGLTGVGVLEQSDQDKPAARGGRGIEVALIIRHPFHMLRAGSSCRVQEGWPGRGVRHSMPNRVSQYDLGGLPTSIRQGELGQAAARDRKNRSGQS